MTDMVGDVSVLMAVYDGVAVCDLEDALRALERQTFRPREVLVVQDGALRSELKAVLHAYLDRLPIHVHEVATRQGSGPARNRALLSASSTWAAVVDADDVSMPRRLEIQLREAESRGLDVVGTAMTEFTPGHRHEQYRVAPEGDRAIRRRVRMNNPFNHPTLMFRVDVGRRAGGYRDLPFLEDYDFAIRLLSTGARAANLPEPLVRYRLSNQALRRRAARGVTKSELRLQRTLHEHGFVSAPRAVVNVMVRSGYRLLPVPLKRAFGRHFLARPSDRQGS